MEIALGGEPQFAGRRLQDALDGAGFLAGPRGRVESTSLVDPEPSLGTRPDSALETRLEDGPLGGSFEALRGDPEPVRSIPAPDAGSGRGDDGGAVGSLGDSDDEEGVGVGRRDLPEPIARPDEQPAAVGAGPDPPVASEGEGPDLFIRESLGWPEVLEVGAALPEDTSAGDGDPEVAVVGFDEVADAVEAEGGGVAVVEGLEADAVEADETFVGADPEVAVAGLEEGGDGLDGETVLESPGAEGEGGKGEVGLGGEQAGREGSEREEAQAEDDEESPGRQESGHPGANGHVWVFAATDGRRMRASVELRVPSFQMPVASSQSWELASGNWELPARPPDVGWTMCIGHSARRCFPLRFRRVRRSGCNMDRRFSNERKPEHRQRGVVWVWQSLRIGGTLMQYTDDPQPQTRMKSSFLPWLASILGLAGGLRAQLFETTQTNPILSDGEGASLLDSRAMVTVSYQPYNEFVDNVFYSVGNGLFFTKPFGRFLRASPAGVGFADGDVIDGGNSTYTERPFEGNAVLGLRSFRWSIIQPSNQLRISAGSEFFPGKQEVLIGFAVNVGGQDQYGWVRMRRPVIDTVTIFSPVAHALHPVPGLPIRAGKAPELPVIVTEFDAGSGNLKLNWPAGLAGVRLQEADSLKTPMVWRDVEGGPDGEYEVPLPSEGQVFFRLQHGP